MIVISLSNFRFLKIVVISYFLLHGWWSLFAMWSSVHILKDGKVMNGIESETESSRCTKPRVHFSDYAITPTIVSATPPSC